MTGRNAAEERISRWLTEQAQGELPDWVLRDAFVRTRASRQAPVRLAWRFLEMTRSSVRLVAVGAAAIALIALALIVGVGGGPGPAPTPTPTAISSPSAAGPSPEPTTNLDTATWTAYTSPRMGITTRFPSGWAITPATAPWIWQTHDPGPPDGAKDVAQDSRRRAFVISSEKLPGGMDESSWWADYLSVDTTGMPAGCFPATRAEYQQVTVDGLVGYLHGGIAGCNFTEVIAVVGGRGYQLTAYFNLLAPFGGVFDRDLFDAWLTTVHFDPTSADDTPAEGASPAAT